jgi:hypothetical protein
MKKILVEGGLVCNKSAVAIVLIIPAVAGGIVMLMGTFAAAAFANNDHWGPDPGRHYTVLPSTACNSLARTNPLSPSETMLLSCGTTTWL